MNKIKKIGLLGVTGYTGYQLLKMIRQHPQMELAFATTEQKAGVALRGIYPQIPAVDSIGDLAVLNSKDAQEIPVDAIFSCLPHAAAAEKLHYWIQKGIPVVDLSADFRIRDPKRYEAAYHTHPFPELLSDSVYGLVEFYKEQILSSKIIGNPGCYPTSILLPLLPLIAQNLIEVDDILVDSKSGVSGAGKSPSDATHFCEVHENFSAYKVADEHRHLSEIDEQLSLVAEQNVKICFTPHLLPMAQGILSTIYVKPKAGVTESQITKAWEIYQNSPFVDVLASGLPKTSWVRGTNRCIFGHKWAFNGKRLVIVSVIDNLIKGASGQAMQNMNLLLGLPETLGLGDMP